MPSPEEQAFWDFANERHNIYLLRRQGVPEPWTHDPILQKYHFCNVFRELDATTEWFKCEVRDPLSGTVGVLWATVLFRLFNSIPTGERFLALGGSCWGQYHDWHYPSALYAVRQMERAGQSTIGGAYVQPSPAGMTKGEGLCHVAEQIWCQEGDHEIQHLARLIRDGQRIETAVKLLTKALPFVGRFIAYEIATDLTHTTLLTDAWDRFSWANPGPGAVKGLRWVFPKALLEDRQAAVDLTNYLTEESVNEFAFSGMWEPRDTEHTLCEFGKYMRTKAQGVDRSARKRRGLRHG